MKRKLTVLLTILAMLVCAVFAVVGCTPEEPVEPAGPEGGAYYCVTNDDYKITLGDNYKFTFKVAGENRQGTYRFAGNTLILTFDDDTKIEATLDNYNELNFEYKNVKYGFLRETNFKVKFETSGGSAVTEQTVKNGKTASKPNSPTKSGEIFTGWYADEGLENKFDFESAITKDTTLYAKYIEAIDKNPEFTAKFANVDTEIEPLQTKGGVVDINKVTDPSRNGDKFLGWYVSASNDGKKLTYKYDFQSLNENTTLYALWESELGGAPEVSVYNGKVTWKGEGATMVIKMPGGGTVTPKISGNEYTIPADTLSVEGEYEIKVTVGEKSTTRYYIHKGLARVSVFKIEENTVQFNMVDNAKSYALTVTTKTGNQTLEVELDDTARVGHADFSACDIPENGYVFKVKAEANGYAASESEPYTYNRVLGSVANISVDEATQNISWDSVTNATGYAIEIDGVKSTVQEEKATLRNLDPKPEPITIKVQPTAFGYNSPIATEKTYNKVKLAVPDNIHLEGTDLKWGGINGVKEYEITINGTKYTSKTSEFKLEESYMKDGKMEITIVAKGETEDKNSPISDMITLRNGEIGNVRYDAGKLKWDASFGKADYEIQVGENGEIVPVTGPTEKEIVLTGKKTQARVRIQGTGDDGWHTITIEAYEIKIAMGFDDLYYGKMYKQEGDPIDFDNKDSIIWEREIDKQSYKKRTGYDFTGFFSNDYNSGGDNYQLETYTLKKDTEFFAKWTPHTHEVSFDLNFAFFENNDKGGFVSNEETINSTQFTFDSKEYKWPVPEQIIAGYMFEGWYLFDIDGNPLDIDYYNTQHKFADQFGAAATDKSLTFDKNIKAYAKWVRVVDFVENNSGWTATKNTSYTSMTKLTIPAVYKGQQVTQVEDFKSCRYLTEINIPETVTAIHMGDGGEAFTGCTVLVNVNIYEVDDYKDNPKYCSKEGVLYENDGDGKLNKLFYYPYGRLNYYSATDNLYSEYTVEKGTRIIGMGAFYGPYGSTTPRNFKTLNIPASVQEIESTGFYQCYGLETINFLPVGKDESEADNIILREDSFKSCSNVTSLNLPKRMKSISAKLLQVFTKLNKLTVESGGKYYANDNVLYFTRNDGDKELVFYPMALGFTKNSYTTPNDIQHIGAGAFRKATTLYNLTISAQVESIGDEAFMDSRYIQSITFLGEKTNNDLSIGTQAFYNVSNGSKAGSTTAPAMKDYKLVLPANLMALGAYAFGSNERITEVEFTTSDRESVNFAQYAFAKKPAENAVNPTYDAYVTKVTINAEVPTFNIMNVMGKKLTTVTIVGENPNFKQDKVGAVFNPDFSEMLFFPSDFKDDYTIPEGMTVIPDEMFQTRSLTGIHIHNKVRMIGRRAFYNCKDLLTLTFEDGTLDADDPGLVIGESAFDGCNKLTTVVLPHTLTQLNNYAFARCTVLESINIPNSVQNMEVVKGKFQVFYQSKKLKSVEIETGNPNYIAADGILYTVREVKKGTDKGEGTEFVADTLLWCPSGATGTVTVPSSVRTVAGYAFYNVDGLTKVTFADLVATENADEENLDVVDLTLGAQAFYEESSATSADKPAHGIEEIVFPSGMKSLGAQTSPAANAPIIYLSSLKKIFIPNTVEKLYTFQYKCEAISEVEFEQGGEDGLEIIGGSSTGGGSTYYGPLGDLPLITSVTLPERVTLLENFPFAYYSSGEESSTFRCYVNEVKFTESDTFDLTLGVAAFYRMENLKVTLPKNLVTIDPGTSKYYYGVFYHTSFANDTLDLSKTNLKSIGRNAFQYVSGLKHIYFPSSLETLGQDAFQGYITGSGSNLETITFNGPSNLTQMTSAFEYQTKLNKVTFADAAALGDDGKPKTLDLIDSVFRCCYSLKDIKLPYYIKTIGEDVFEKCTTLSSIEFALDNENKSYLEEIGTTAFSYISAKEFTLPMSHAANGIKLNPQVFLNSLNLRTLNISDSVRDLTGALEGTLIDTINTDKDGTTGSPYFSIDNETHTLKDNNGNIILIFADTTTYTIPVGTQKIGAGAFTGIVGLKNIIIPESVTEIGANAFKDCLDLQTVTFAADSKLTTIGDRAFSGCTSLVSADFTPCTRLTSVGNYLFERCASLEKVKFSQSVKLFTAVAKGQYMFQYSGLKTFDFNEFGGGATVVPNYFFQYCRSLTSVTFSPSIKTMPTSTFVGCTALATLNDYESIETWSPLSDTAIESFTMHGKSTGGKAITYPSSFFGSSSSSFVNNHLRSIKFDDNASSITTIQSNMFTSCVNLSDFDFTKLTGLKTINATAFKNTGLINVDLTQCTQLATVKATIFQNCTQLQSVKMNTCTLLTKLDGASVFEGCTSLTEVLLPPNLTYLGTKTFSGCSDLQSIDLSTLTQLEYIGSAAGKATLSGAAENFKNCTSLTSVKLRDAGGIYLGKAVFSGCIALESFDFTKVVQIGDNCFEKSGLTSVDIPSTVTETWGTSPFSGCEKLTSVHFADGYDVAGNKRLDSCTALVNVNLSNTGYTVLPQYFFYKCSALESVTLPDAITDLGNYAFTDCIALDSFDFTPYNSIATISAYCFNGCKNLQNVTLTANIKAIARYAFKGCTSLQTIDMSMTKVTLLGGDGTNGTYDKLTTTAETFSGCSALDTVKFPSSCVGIAGKVFMDCTSLKTIDLSKITDMGSNVFDGVTLNSLAIPALATFQANTFSGLTVDGKIDIGSNAKFKLVTVSDDETGVLYVELRSIDEKTLYITGKPSVNIKPVNGVVDLSTMNLGEAAVKAILSALPEGVDKVILPKSLVEIGEKAFYELNTSAAEIVIPDGVTSIGKQAFGYVKAKITLPSTLMTLGEQVFYYAEIDEITIPKSVKTIGTRLFYYSKVHVVKFEDDPDATEQISLADGLFYNCKELTTARLPKNLTVIPAETFYHTDVLADVNFDELTITSIGKSAFGYSGLTEFTAPASLTLICSSAFNQAKITTVTFNDNAHITLESTAFGSSKLNTINWPKGTGTVTLRDRVFNATELVNVEIPSCVKFENINAEVEEYNVAVSTFLNCKLLESCVFVGKSELTEVCGMFNGCVELRNVVLPEGITRLGFSHVYAVTSSGNSTQNGMFKDCAKLQTVKLPETLEEIANINVFTKCTSLTRLVIPEKVNIIESSSLTTASFYGWTDEQTIVIKGDRYTKIKVLGLGWYYGCNARVEWGGTDEPATQPQVPSTEPSTNATTIAGETVLLSADRRRVA